ncbi:DUF2255 family protein [Streptomyces sp. NPDC101455]|uniref:DUF2255 family protein n=1 Tax=Streptomyces sp. NPDC101455 TaxID=3366142 RepID=UPI00382BB728
MTTWNSDEHFRISTADEPHIAPQRADGGLRQLTPVWVVRDGDDLVDGGFTAN